VKTVSVNKKATGTVTLYNNYSTEPYDLIKTTRLQTAKGSVYRLTADVRIPGKKTAGGKDTPGTVNATVEADLPGSEYNAKGGTELRLPGLVEGSLRYNQIYAKVVTNFTGGAKGTAPDLSASGVESAVNAAKEQASADFLASAKTENPDLLFLPDSINVTTSFDSTKIPASTGGQAEMPVRVTVKAIGLKRDALKAELESHLTAKTGQAVVVSPDVLDVLNYAVTDTEDDSLTSGAFKIKVSGSVMGSYSGNMSDALKQQLAGMPLGSAKLVIDEKFPNQDVSVRAWPFWMDKVPTDLNKIKVEIAD
jgi:hypothetical protein